jgi:hypothetical protein
MKEGARQRHDVDSRKTGRTEKEERNVKDPPPLADSVILTVRYFRTSSFLRNIRGIENDGG